MAIRNSRPHTTVAQNHFWLLSHYYAYYGYMRVAGACAGGYPYMTYASAELFRSSASHSERDPLLRSKLAVNNKQQTGQLTSCGRA